MDPKSIAMPVNTSEEEGEVKDGQPLAFIPPPSFLLNTTQQHT
jgi:hypothetical protein